MHNQLRKCEDVFLEALYKRSLEESSTNLYIEVRGIKTRENGITFREYYKSIKDLLQNKNSWDNGLNYYFGVALRVNSEGGKKEDCGLLTALFVDVDYGQKGHKKKNTWQSRQEALEAIIKFPIKPSILVHSGYGFQAYWLLKEPVDLKNGGIERVESLHQGLAQVLGGDIGTQDVSRILRIPGTYNVKIPDEPKLVTLEWCEPNLHYSLADFSNYSRSGETSKATRPSAEQISQENLAVHSLKIPDWTKTLILSGIYDGYASRSDRDHAVIEQLTRAGYDFQTVLAVFKSNPIGTDPEKAKFIEKGEFGIKYLEHSYRKMMEKKASKQDKLQFTPKNAADLEKKKFAELQWAVKGILIEGLTILSGPPKVGKSFLALAVSVAIAKGGVALGHIPVEQGSVLFLGLEDSEKRLKSRIGKILGRDNSFPEKLYYHIDFPKLSQGIEVLGEYLSNNPDCKLVVIDTLARVRESSFGKRQGAYDQDVEFLAPLQKLAHKHRVAILAIHHTRKREDEDFVNTVSGTLGLSGTADAVMVLKRGRGKVNGTLSITGRDIEERELALKFHPEDGCWELIGDAFEVAKSDQRKEIIEFLKENKNMKPKDIAEALGKEHGSVRKLLRSMANDGEVISESGVYALPGGNNNSVEMNNWCGVVN